MRTREKNATMVNTKMSRTSHSTAVVQLAEGPGLSGYVFAIGRIRHFFPALDIEKEYKQLVPKPLPPELNGAPEDRILQWVLEQNPFLAREMGWVFLIQNVSTYVLIPRSPIELEQFVKAIVPASTTEVTYDVIVGVQDPAALVGAGDGSVPGVTVNRTYQFTLTELVDSVIAALRAQGVAQPPNRAQITDLFDDLLQLADNTGDADEHRALNYVSVNYPEIYMPQSPGGPGAPATAYFTGVETRRSPLGGGRAIIDVIVSYTNQTSGVVTKFYTSIDVSGQFPYLATPLQPYFER
jgi:hypothetical protein